ncbi:MAG: single-stranded DNA-binding protein [Micrococcus sp.]|nr:single-stranded DNA-binding protein [Micrococcus sp.]
MQDTITIRGRVANDPVQRRTEKGLPITAFRLASTQRRFDRQTQQWVDAHTNWYSVSTFATLAENTAQCLKRGNPVIITGRLRIRDWSTEERSGRSVDIVADAIGLDLNLGVCAFQKNPSRAPADADATAGDGAEGSATGTGTDTWLPGASVDLDTGEIRAITDQAPHADSETPDGPEDMAGRDEAIEDDDQDDEEAAALQREPAHV